MEKLLLRPKRKPDKTALVCEQCQFKFTLTIRRHHCRCCGGVFCAQCSSKNRHLPELGYAHVRRVCDTCWSKTSNEIFLEMKNRISLLPPDIQIRLEALANEYIEKKLADEGCDDDNSSDGETESNQSSMSSFMSFPKMRERRESSLNVLGPWSLTAILAEEESPSGQKPVIAEEVTIPTDVETVFINIGDMVKDKGKGKGVLERRTTESDKGKTKEKEKEREKSLDTNEKEKAPEREKSLDTKEKERRGSENGTENNVQKHRRETASYWCVEDVCDWLGDLKLGEETKGYLKSFRELQVDGQALLALTNEDLYDEKKLHIVSFGHRKKIMAAIATLKVQI